MYACLQVTKSEVGDRQRAVDLLNDFSRNMSGESPTAGVAECLERFADITDRYHSVSRDVNERSAALNALLPRWEEFGDHVRSLDEWIDKQTTVVAQLATAPLDTAVTGCQVH